MTPTLVIGYRGAMLANGIEETIGAKFSLSIIAKFKSFGIGFNHSE
jgi:hypothetical protein